jgi:alcohol dehydrogenase
LTAPSIHRPPEISTAASRNGDFDFLPLTRVVFGAGTIRLLGRHAADLGGRRVLLVSDAHLVAVGHVEHAIQSIREANLEPVVFDHAEENPTTRTVDECAQFARESRIDLIVGLGGGSSMDCAKGCNFILTNGGRMQDYWGTGKATQPMLPMIAVPTTAGTGSEAQSFALIADEKTHQKMACGDKKAAARVAILDPELTVTMPASVSSATGIDAISHAVETYVTTRRNPLSQVFSREAWRLLEANFETVLRDPNNIEARGAMLLGANFAGTAIENSMLGATHACANPLTAHLGLAHGIAIGLMLPHVVRFNGPVVEHAYAELIGSSSLDVADFEDAAGCLAARIGELVAESGQPQRLSDCGLDRELIPVLADEAMHQWTGKFNPRPLNHQDFVELYQCAL